MIVNYEVRCSRYPEKVIGWVPIEHVLQPHEWWSFELRCPLPERPPLAYVNVGVPIIRLEVAEFRVSGRLWLALKSGGTPLETLRRIPGFRENR